MGRTSPELASSAAAWAEVPGEGKVLVKILVSKPLWQTFGGL